MKNLLFIPIFLLATLNTSACSDTNKNKEVEPVIPVTGSILITYFSYPEPDGVDVSTGASRLVNDGKVTGHVDFLANVIREATDGELFEIKTVQQYPASHEPLVSQASEEKEAKARPVLTTHIENIDQYDIIFIGYPNWWGDFPMPLYTFLEKYDLKGKTIIPFNSHGGSGLSGTVNTIKELQPESTIVKAFSVSRNNVSNAKEDVLKWLKEIGMME